MFNVRMKASPSLAIYKSILSHDTPLGNFWELFLNTPTRSTSSHEMSQIPVLRALQIQSNRNNQNLIDRKQELLLDLPLSLSTFNTWLIFTLDQILLAACLFIQSSKLDVLQVQETETIANISLQPAQTAKKVLQHVQ